MEYTIYYRRILIDRPASISFVFYSRDVSPRIHINAPSRFSLVRLYMPGAIMHYYCVLRFHGAQYQVVGG
jgi:hypothetical protein